EIQKQKINSYSLSSEPEVTKKLINLKGSVSSSCLPSNVNNANNFTVNFKRSHPWQAIFLPDIVDKAIEQILSKIIQDFVLSWYSKISVDDGLIYEIKSLFRHILANLILRIKEVDWAHFITFRINSILFNHVSEFENTSIFYSNSKERLDHQFELLEKIREAREIKSVHTALTSRDEELKYLRKISKKIFSYLFPEHILKCRPAIVLLEEIMSLNLMLRGLDSLAEPDSINKILSKLFQNRSKNDQQNDSNKRENVQLLKHWCQMNGRIFKSILVPSFDEIIENNELLHVFLNYFSSINSLSILQFYLMLRDIEQNFGDISKSENNPNFNTQIVEIKNWCQMNKNLLKTLAFDHKENFDQKMDAFISEIESASDKNNLKSKFKEIHDALYDIIKYCYYDQFIKSEFMYKNFMGMRKIYANWSNRKKKDKNLDNRSETDSSSLFLDENEGEELSLNENHFSNDKVDLIEEINEDEFDQLDFNTIEDELIKPSPQVRLDLINEIKDEFNDKDFSVEKSSDKDEDEEVDSDSDENKINLSNLRIAIDQIEELVDKSNKTCFVFIIQIWAVDPKSPSDFFNQKPNWSVKRKYDEFYVLDNRLKEFHGELINEMEYNVNNPNTITVQLPSKPRTVFFNSSKNFDYLNSVKKDFAKYLQSLLSNPILSMSQLIKSFLDPNSTDFSSSIFNDITSIGKMVKGVPYKLRVERGQSLDMFLINLLKSVRQSKPRDERTQTPNEDTIMKLLKNPIFENPDQKYFDEKSERDSNNFNNYLTPFESFIFLIKEIYRIPHWLSILFFSLKNLYEKSLNSFIFWTIWKNLKNQNDPETLRGYLNQFEDLIFQNNNTKESSEELYGNALDSINDFIRNLLNPLHLTSFSSTNEIIENGTKLFLEAFQYPIWNKHVPKMESKLYNYAKCSVPILNNTSPNNYTIMSALLSHIDSPLVSSNSQLSSPINSYPNIISSHSFPNQTIQSTFSKSVRQRSSPHKHTKCTNDHTSPKEIIYTTKRINLPNLEQTEPNQNMILLESNPDLNISESAANLTSDQFQNEQIDNLIVIEARKEFEMGTAASMINSNSIQNDYSVENNFENNASQASQILDQINFEAYKNYVFNEQPNFINDQSEQSTFNETNGHAQDSNLVTYTISCPSNWQHNLDQMLNCFVSLDHFKTENVQLKCSICLKKFYDINDL
ncbi:sorting nexin-14 isoform X1, partial [Brachionus plicatilis]